MSKKQDFLLPSLFDRLTDLEPKKYNSPTLGYQFDIKLYKNSILRDILFILNTTNLQSYINHKLNEECIQKSTINFGTTAFSGNNLSDINWFEFEKDIENCLRDFEPRLDPETIKVDILLNEKNSDRLLVVKIYGVLKLTPYTEELFLKTSMDIELGTFELLEA